jgi:hypothetical protein
MLQHHTAEQQIDTQQHVNVSNTHIPESTLTAFLNGYGTKQGMLSRPHCQIPSRFPTFGEEIGLAALMLGQICSLLIQNQALSLTS